MQIVQAKEESVLVELSYEELKRITKEKVYSYDEAHKMCRLGTKVSVGIWAKEFEVTTEARIKDLQNTLNSVLKFLNNRIEVLNLIDTELKD